MADEVVVQAAADLVLAYVRKADGKLALIKLLTPQNAWTKEVLVHPQAITGGDISLARLDDGDRRSAWTTVSAVWSDPRLPWLLAGLAALLQADCAASGVERIGLSELQDRLRA